MKKIALAAFAVLSLGLSNQTFAQNILPIKDIHYRVEGGFNVTDLMMSERGDVQPTSNKSGLRLGGVAELGFHKYVFATTGLFYNMGGASFNVGDGSEISESIRTQALTLPFTIGGRVGLTPDVSLSLETGPFVQYLLSAENTINSKRKNKVWTNNLFERKEFKRMNMGWGLSVAGAYKNYIFRVGSEWGMKNISAEDIEVTSSEVFFTLGYKF